MTDDVLKRVVNQDFGDQFVRMNKSLSDHLELLDTALSMLKPEVQEKCSMISN